ncbi:MAG: acyl-CoA dehydratase activase [Armatimonadota bacterium]
MGFLGVDIGSVSVKCAWISREGMLLGHTYRRHYGRPLEIARQLLDDELREHGQPEQIAFTGSGAKGVAEVLGVPFENEVVAQARATAHLTPQVNSVIAVGGEDSFLIMLDHGGSAETAQIRDFAMNGLCAAGCGSFLDQQASRLGVNIEEEFGALALASEKPARVAGRCSVFAKSDMIHLQQKATPVCDIVAGLCFAFARNFSAVLARGKECRPPVAFHGGVALNVGMVRAFREILELAEEDFIVPEYAPAAGAVGAALLARNAGERTAPLDLAPMDAFIARTHSLGMTHPPLPDPGPPPGSHLADIAPGPPIDAYLGVDIGSISTNVVLIDSEKRVLAKSYLMTAGRPIEAVRQGLTAVGDQFADKVVVRGVCTTGSGRYLIGDFLGADVVKNEITAQARAAAEIDPRVDTIFEIGGQDSKYISLENGAIVDFEMNKVCAAGTGSFLEEQAERLGVSIKGEFSQLALASPAPVRLGERCTVFIESDLVVQQSRGAATGDLAAGLAYSIVHNYLNRVVGERRVGDHIFFQGGTAFNRSVVAAFRQVTGKPVTVPEHHEVTGAIGCALIAREHSQPGVPSRFKGWDLSTREYKQDSFECKACSNRCTINRVQVAGEDTLFYGGRCEKYEKKRIDSSGIPDLFAERDALLMAGYTEPVAAPGKPLIGLPRALHFTEYAPFWMTFFQSLNLPVRFSPPTDKPIINDGLEAVAAEFCFPVKVAHGHVMELLQAGATHIFLPNILQLPKLHEQFTESVACPYVQSLACTIKAAIDLTGKGAEMLAPVVDLSGPSRRTVQALYQSLKSLGVTSKGVKAALEAARAAQKKFGDAMLERGRRVLAELPKDGLAVVIVSRPYNGCDNGVNMEIPLRFRELGVLPIPMDMLPLDAENLSSQFPHLSWRYGQKIIATADYIRSDTRLHAVYITNFGCGPDSFLVKFFRNRMDGKTFLQLEIDEHSSDVGAITRCEAFLDSLHHSHYAPGLGKPFRSVAMPGGEKRVMYIPNMCDLAYALAAAFRSVGQPSEVLPEADAESVAIGKRYCSGKECLPCIVTTGDAVRLVNRPDIDPDQVAFFMPSVAGGCRLGYYNVLQRMVLDEMGHDQVPIFSPNQDRGFYNMLNDHAGDAFVRRAWQGIVAIELLEKALHFVRPYEMTPGSADRVYQDYLRQMEKIVEIGADLEPLMHAARAAFAAIPTTSADGRPWIGIVGEVYVRMHRYSNQDLIRRVEELGGRVWLAPFTEWMYYVNLNQKEDARLESRWMGLFKLAMVDRVMKSDEHRLAHAWEGFIPNLHEPSPETLLANGTRYINPAYRSEAVLGMGKSMQFHKDGLDGVINVMPFTCMPGTITSGLFRRFQQDHNSMPVLNLAFEGQESGDLPVRLEAFIQQCLGYKGRRGK